MSKQVIVPISNIDRFVTDGTYVGVALRFRLKNKDSQEVSQWSPVKLLKFFPYYGYSPYKITQTNGYNLTNSLSRSTNFNNTSLNVETELPSSQIDQISSQSTGTHSPERDSYQYTWSKPLDCNIKNFDVYTSWNIFSYVSTTGTLSAPSGVGPYTGTLTLPSSATNMTISLKTFHDVTGVTNPIKLYGGPDSVTPGNSFTITGYSSGNVFNIQSASTWTSSGTIKNISRSHAWTDFEYIGTTNQNSYMFDRKMYSNKLTATVTSGVPLVKVNEDLITSGVVPGMILYKKSGDGAFSTSTPIISHIDYSNNIIFLSDSVSSTTVASTTGSIGSRSGSGPYTATITGMSSTSSLYVDAIITATAGTANFGAGIVTVTSILSSSSITISSTKTFTGNGSVTNISHATRRDNSASGYIEFIATSNQPNSTSVSTVNRLWSSGTTNIYADNANTIPITQYFAKPMFVQAIAMASSNKRTTDSLPNEYTIFSISEAQSTYFDGYGTIANRTSIAPFTGTLTGMNLPFSASIANVGLRTYAENSVSGAVSLGGGEVKLADYVNGVRSELASTSALNNGTVVSIRL